MKVREFYHCSQERLSPRFFTGYDPLRGSGLEVIENLTGRVLGRVGPLDRIGFRVRKLFKFITDRVRSRSPGPRNSTRPVNSTDYFLQTRYLPLPGREYSPGLRFIHVRAQTCTISRPERHVCIILRGTILNRTYGLYKNLYISLFLLTIFGPCLPWSPAIVALGKHQSDFTSTNFIHLI